MRPERITQLQPGDSGGKGPVIYWMSRDQRTSDNWALIHAQNLALDRKRPLLVVFCLAPSFLGAAIRQYGFMLRGLKEVQKDLETRGIPFILLAGEPGREVPRLMEETKACHLVSDFDPLRVKRQWKEEVGREVSVPFTEVDAHNVVPCRLASEKQEYGAYTIRPKINRLLPEFLETFPRRRRHPFPWTKRVPRIDWDGLISTLRVDRRVPEVSWITPGERAAKRVMKGFIGRKLAGYSETSNDPNAGSQSDLSPYLHFGQISAQRVALEVVGSGPGGESVDDFLEELVVRRELADNFCFYNPSYDRFEGFPRWAAETLDHHRGDERPYIYSREDFDQARTHDRLWNAAQMEMVARGKMHGYMRMYWAKKILEWSPSPEEAIETAIALNDRYELDGRDPNGYTGIAWSIGGVHDRAWGERPIFGKVRYMSEKGARTKFDVEEYIKGNLGK